MSHLRALQLQQIAAFCRLYCEARRDGCTVREKFKDRKQWGIKLENAMRYEALLEANAELGEGTMEPERVKELLVPLILQQRAQAAPVQPAPTELSFAERMLAVMCELRQRRHERGVVCELAKKHNVSRQAIWCYTKELRYELEREPPLADEVFRQLVLRKVAERDQRQYAHKR
jgi:hypothetical protein